MLSPLFAACGYTYAKKEVDAMARIILVLTIVAAFQGVCWAATWDPAADNYTGRKGVTFYVSKLGDNSDGLSWPTAFTTVQKALDAIPDALGGHTVVVRPDTYMEANLSVAHPAAAGSYNLLIGDVDGRYGSGTSGRVILDSGDPEKGMKSYDWWGNIRSYKQGWSQEHTAPTFSAIVWDRWILRNLYATGGDGGLFWDATDRVEPFTILVEDCTGIGRAFGGGVGNCLSRYDEPITFRRCNLWALDWWGDTAGAYVRIENPQMPERNDVVFEDCTMVSPQCALKGGNFGFHTYMRIKVNRCRLVTLNFSQPAGTPTDGIVQSVQNGKYLHVDFEDSTLMGYKVFGVRVDKDSVGDIGYSVKGNVQAYVQHTQDVPKGMLRLGAWPAGVFDTIAEFSTGQHPGTGPQKPVLTDETLVQKDMCEVSPVVWQGRECLLACLRPASGGTSSDYWMEVRDAQSGEPLARLGEGHSLACAFAGNDALYVFASRFKNDNWNDVTLFKSTGLKNWEQKIAIVQDPTEHLFNSSVCATPDGYLMAYETNDPAYPAFTVKFAKSTDLMNWTKMPDALFGKDRYTACPAVRYADGFYYLLYTEHRTPRWFFETYIARSTDLAKWDLSPMNPVLTADGLDEGINASDPDLVEFGGKTRIYYAVGDQRTWMNIKSATYNGRVPDFLKRWF